MEVAYAKWMTALALAGAIAMATPAVAEDPEQACLLVATTIDAKLACLNGVRVLSSEDKLGYRVFEMRITQELDHRNAAAGTFEERIVLIHRNEADPMVLQTSGYEIFSVKEALLTSTFQTNQIQVEHRFFADSMPATPMNWAKYGRYLTVRQAAEDFHHIAVTFKKIYGGHWVNNGGSKGGMTSIFHRRFYPSDVDGTVAEVAPLSMSDHDPRYVTRVETMGGDKYAACREAIKRVQVQLLSAREILVPKIEGHFDHLGSADVAFEHAVIEMPYYFWQYSGPSSKTVNCDTIPTEGTVEEMMTFLGKVHGMDNYTDETITEGFAFYYQCATELGSPANSLSKDASEAPPTWTPAHLKDLVRYAYQIRQYAPKGVDLSFSNDTLLDMDQWAMFDAERVIFTYGEFDPYSAAPFPLNVAGRDTYRFVMPGGNHTSKYLSLPEDQQAQFLSLLSSWFGKAVPAPMPSPAAQ